MTVRDDLVNVMQNEVAKTGLTDTTEKVYRVILLTNVMKMLITGRSKYDIVRLLNQQSNRCGRDLLPVLKEVHGLIKDVEL
jgi:chorismate-pyruvate lyase